MTLYLTPFLTCDIICQKNKAPSVAELLTGQISGSVDDLVSYRNEP